MSVWIDTSGRSEELGKGACMTSYGQSLTADRNDFSVSV
jgi:hypothetical protein